jgi:hypothetical protein
MPTNGSSCGHPQCPPFLLITPLYPFTHQPIKLSSFSVGLVTIFRSERHQIGGEPCWIEEEETPTCPRCGKEMTFLAQIDSISPEVSFGDVGIVYVFYCFDCLEGKVFAQSY